MPGEIAPSAAPDWAVLTWCDLRSVYMQFPSQNGPCVVTFARDSLGLAKALDLLKTRHTTEGHGQTYLAPPPPIKRDARFTPVQRDIVREILRKRGIVGR